MSTETPKDEPQEFATVLLNHAKGRAHDEASNLLTQAVQAVRDTGKKASITVKFDVHPVKGNPDVVQIEDNVTASIPTDKRASIWFSDDAGTLFRNDPTQASMFDVEVHHGS